MMDEEKQPLLWFCRVLTAAAAMFAALLAQVAVPGADVIRPVSAAYQSETDNYDATIPVRTDRFEEVTYSTVMREDGRLQIVDSNGGFVSDMLGIPRAYMAVALMTLVLTTAVILIYRHSGWGEKR